MSNTARGILKAIGNEIQVSDRFKKREFVVTLEPTSQYPQHVQFQLVQDKCDLIDPYNEGEEIIVHFNLRGREWTRDNEVRYFNTLDVWRLEKVKSEQTERPTKQNLENDINNNDLPF